MFEPLQSVKYWSSTVVSSFYLIPIRVTPVFIQCWSAHNWGSLHGSWFTLLFTSSTVTPLSPFWHHMISLRIPGREWPIMGVLMAALWRLCPGRTKLRGLHSCRSPRPQLNMSRLQMLGWSDVHRMSNKGGKTAIGLAVGRGAYPLSLSENEGPHCLDRSKG